MASNGLDTSDPKKDLNFLPILLDLVQSIDRESPDANQRALDFQAQLRKARDVTEHLPGVQFTREEQLRRIRILRQQLQIKCQLLHKYKHTPSFNLQRDHTL